MLILSTAPGASEGSVFIGMVILMLWIIGCAAFYFLPAIVAHRREHTRREAILVLNLVAGWTFFGWVAALVWAFTEEKKAQ